MHACVRIWCMFAHYCALLRYRNSDSILVFALSPWYQGASINYHKQWFFSTLIFDFKGGSRFFQMHDRKNRCIFEIFSFSKTIYFCVKHLISLEDNTISQIFIFHTALTYVSMYISDAIITDMVNIRSTYSPLKVLGLVLKEVNDFLTTPSLYTYWSPYTVDKDMASKIHTRVFINREIMERN